MAVNGGDDPGAEERQLDTRQRIDAFDARPGSAGARPSACVTMQWMRQRLAELERSPDTPEHQFRVHDPWAMELFLAVARHWGLHPFRRRGQRYNTVNIRVSHGFMERTLWPQFRAVRETLDHELERVTEEVIAWYREEAEGRPPGATAIDPNTPARARLRPRRI